MFFRSLAFVLFFASGLFIDIGPKLKFFNFFGVGALVFSLLAKVPIRISRLEVIFLVLIFYGGGFTLFSRSFDLTFRIFFGSLLYFFSYLGIRNWLMLVYESSPDRLVSDLRLAGLIFAVSSILPYLFSWYLFSSSGSPLGSLGLLGGGELDRGLFRLRGFSQDPNIFGVSVLFFLCFYLFFNPRTSFVSIFSILVLILCLVLSLSRGALLAFVFSFLAYLFLRGSASKSFFWGSVVGACACAIAYFWSGEFSGGFVQGVVERRLQNFGSGSGRLRIWQESFEVFSNYPVFGVGWFAFVSNFRFAHNTFIELAVELGFLGLFLYCFWLLFVFVESADKKLGEWRFFLAPFIIALVISSNTLSLFLYEGYFIALAVLGFLRWRVR